MSKPFDTAMKHRVEAYPLAWLEYVGLPTARAEVIDTDLATVTAGADKLIKVYTDPPYLTHLEFQSNYDALMGDRTLFYNVVERHRQRLPVRSVVILLRRKADGPAMTGRVRYEELDGEVTLEFRYRVVRVWEKPVAAVLAGPLGTRPLAPLADVTPEALPGVIRRMQERFEQEVAPAAAADLWAETFVLMGLRYSAEFTRQLLKGVRQMRESSTYQAILEEGMAAGLAKGKAEGLTEGQVKEARSVLLRLGSKRFGAPNARVQAIVESIGSMARLDELIDRILEAESWEELLQ